MRHQLHLDWPNHYFASEMRKKFEPSSTFFRREIFSERTGEILVRMTVLHEKYFAFRKDFSQWKSGFTAMSFQKWELFLDHTSYMFKNL